MNLMNKMIKVLYLHIYPQILKIFLINENRKFIYFINIIKIIKNKYNIYFNLFLYIPIHTHIRQLEFVVTICNQNLLFFIYNIYIIYFYLSNFTILNF